MQKEKYRIWFEIEAYACEAMEQFGSIPKGTTNNVLKASGLDYDINEIDEIEKITKHDVIAFLTYLSKFIGDSSRFVHQGLTSSDVLDTCFNVQLVNASEILEKGLQNLLDVIKERALEHPRGSSGVKDADTDESERVSPPLDAQPALLRWLR